MSQRSTASPLLGGGCRGEDLIFDLGVWDADGELDDDDHSVINGHNIDNQ